MDEEKKPIDTEEGISGCTCGCTASDEDVDKMLDDVFGPDEPSDNLSPPSSILQDVKKWIGITREYEVFDSDILMSINSTFFTLHQLGVGPSDGFAIDNGTENWSDFSENKMIISAVKQYVMLKVRNTFDPPTSSYVLNANQTKIDELEWRLREQCSGRLDYEEEPPEDNEQPVENPPISEDCVCCCLTAKDEDIDAMLEEVFGEKTFLSHVFRKDEN